MSKWTLDKVLENYKQITHLCEKYVKIMIFSRNIQKWAPGPGPGAKNGGGPGTGPGSSLLPLLASKGKLLFAHVCTSWSYPMSEI